MSTIDEIMEMIYRWEDAADDHLDGALFLTIKSAIDTKDAEIERLRARLAEIEAQEPVATAWITGGRMVSAFNHPPRSDFDPDGRWAEIGYSQQPLYARPVPAQAAPDVIKPGEEK